ncbi:hypothetical protein M8C21_012770 [Ambrosia artemisiifolia]|uniref:Uncharacterized protein n=1 Tax=Ambrosia artemisiifolia TaxID=4212 RepID=A0AAD5GKW9_AMBAR|nr:hypothetical protein M8C21_012770 [Ambrosia artemisiifolia]
MASYDWKRKRISQTLELKYMKKLSTNDEPFQLSSMEIRDIIRIILSLNTPAPETYAQWDEYAISFYLKMCTCYGVDYQHLEAASPDEMDLVYIEINLSIIIIISNNRVLKPG